MGEVTYISMSLGSYIKHTLIMLAVGAATGFMIAVARSELNGTDVTTELIKSAAEENVNG